MPILHDYPDETLELNKCVQVNGIKDVPLTCHACMFSILISPIVFGGQASVNMQEMVLTVKFTYMHI